MGLTRDQQKQVKHLTEDKGYTREEAETVVTQEQLDYPLGLDGEPLVGPPDSTPVTMPTPPPGRSA